MLIDTHCHLHDRKFFSAEQADEMLVRATKNDIKKIVCIGTSIEDSVAAQKFAGQEHKENYPDIYWTFGIHPEGARNLAVVNDLAQKVTTTFTKLLDQASEMPGPVAIGEVGLDYHYSGYDREAQIRLFENMLQLASDHQLPLSFHIREAFADFFPVVANFPKIRGVVHSFSDNKKNLRRILNETDFYVGVNGMATYSTLPTPPLERILLETDAPFLTPVPFRGIINEPGYVQEVATWLSKHLGQDFNTVREVTTKNAKRLFSF